MPMCKKCKDVFWVGELNTEGLCFKCTLSPEEEAKLKEAEEKGYEEALKIKIAKKEDEKIRLQNFFITTETVIDQLIEKRIEVIFAEYVYGLNVIKDFFASIRDFVGGRVASIEEPIRDTNQKILVEMKMKAIALGGDAVVGFKIDYQTGGGFISVLAVGTVVKLKDNNNLVVD